MFSTLTFSTFFAPRWRWATLVVIAGMLFLGRLGFWQLDRLAWRRGENVRKAAQMDAAPLDLNQLSPTIDLPTMWNRRATAVGEYDTAAQLIVRSQIYESQPGAYLLTPLKLAGTDTAVLVNRGWVPTAELQNLATYNITGPVTITGRIQLSEGFNDGRTTEINSANELYRIDLPAIAQWAAYPILPVYLLEDAPPPPDTALPYQLTADLSLDEGNHLSYAYQWFSFAPLLGFIYAYYVAKHSAAVPQT